MDEANAAIGVARLHASGLIDEMLGRIQNDLFDVGADLAVPPQEGEEAGKKLRVSEAQVSRLETEIDQLNAHLAPLTSFVLPGGTPGRPISMSRGP